MNVSRQQTFIPAFNAPVHGGSVVYLIDADPTSRAKLSRFVESCGIRTVAFATASEYLSYVRTDDTSCLILDLHLPDINGLDLQLQLAGKASPPIIFISGFADVQSSVRAIKAGAIEFLTKPVDLPALKASIELAFSRDRALRKKQAEREQLLERFTRLTRREREVLPLVVSGMLNKQAASVLGISEITLQIHRSHVMRKLEAGSLADLVRIALKLRIPEWRNNKFDQPPEGRNAHALRM